jgi:hypothetical protein
MYSGTLIPSTASVGIHHTLVSATQAFELQSCSIYYVGDIHRPLMIEVASGSVANIPRTLTLDKCEIAQMRHVVIPTTACALVYDCLEGSRSRHLAARWPSHRGPYLVLVKAIVAEDVHQWSFLLPVGSSASISPHGSNFESFLCPSGPLVPPAPQGQNAADVPLNGQLSVGRSSLAIERLDFLSHNANYSVAR